MLVGPTYVIVLLAIRSRSRLRTLWALHHVGAATMATSLAGIGLLMLRQARSD